MRQYSKKRQEGAGYLREGKYTLIRVVLSLLVILHARSHSLPDLIVKATLGGEVNNQRLLTSRIYGTLNTVPETAPLVCFQQQWSES